MYTVCWTDTDIITGDSIDHWERCADRRSVAALLIEHGIQDADDVLIFTPDAEDCITTIEDIFASL